MLGTASQVPTRHRNHNGYLLRWDGEGILFDPGEGTQRQMLYAGVAAHDILQRVGAAGYVGGQEDMIIDVALQLAREQDGAPIRAVPS